jgi:hypothetical protein
MKPSRLMISIVIKEEGMVFSKEKMEICVTTIISSSTKPKRCPLAMLN